MAHKKAGASAKMNRDSQSKRLGVKKFGGEVVKVGDIIIRQKGSKYYGGKGVKKGNDYTLFAIIQGKVQFAKKLGKRIVNVV